GGAAGTRELASRRDEPRTLVRSEGGPVDYCENFWRRISNDAQLNVGVVRNHDCAVGAPCLAAGSSQHHSQSGNQRKKGCSHCSFPLVLNKTRNAFSRGTISKCLPHATSLFFLPSFPRGARSKDLLFKNRCR